MSDRPRPGGYVDRAALAKARAANGRLAELVGGLVDGWDRMGRARRLLSLAQIGVKVAEIG